MNCKQSLWEPRFLNWIDAILYWEQSIECSPWRIAWDTPVKRCFQLHFRVREHINYPLIFFQNINCEKHHGTDAYRLICNRVQTHTFLKPIFFTLKPDKFREKGPLFRLNQDDHNITFSFAYPFTLYSIYYTFTWYQL